MMEWQHILPINDLEEHEGRGFDCKCNPTIDWDNMLIIHNAFDCRENFEKEITNDNQD